MKLYLLNSKLVKLTILSRLAFCLEYNLKFQGLTPLKYHYVREFCELYFQRMVLFPFVASLKTQKTPVLKGANC